MLENNLIPILIFSFALLVCSFTCLFLLKQFQRIQGLLKTIVETQIKQSEWTLSQVKINEHTSGLNNNIVEFVENQMEVNKTQQALNKKFINDILLLDKIKVGFVKGDKQ